MNSYCRILVVEAEHDFRQVTAEALKEAGYQVDTAYDDGEAWAALQDSHYDLLIIDQFTPLVSGIELLEMIHFSGLTLPVILATGFLTIEDFVRYPFLKSVRLISKPYSFEKLLWHLQTVEALG